ncbi:Tetratricopeptide-like helical [Penicillium canariense]|uniref:Tetratricopeptide-like helical n=1 Tax=Penicillium canariense TaxID=189055 RepID=A0A9W9HN88_9EURO|nr:Tetratricopeptide-like helical [Penicillium canariense]KAJ5151471.1 Tetratricopeptide-like helical [Penicillium canariense]
MSQKALNNDLKLSVPGDLTDVSNKSEESANIEDPKEVVRHIQRVVDTVPDDYPGLPIWLNNLGVKLLTRYNRTGNLDDLQNAVQHAQRALKIIPEDHPNIASWLTSLSVILVTRYGRIGNLDDLDSAVRLAQRAVDTTPEEEHADLAFRSMILANHFSNRYRRTGNLDDLQNAVRLAQRDVDTIPKGHPDLAFSLNNLANILLTQYDRTGNLGDLQNAVRHAQRALNTVPEDHPDLASWLNNLAVKLLSRYNRAGDLNDLQNAVQYAQRAIDNTAEDHPNMASWLASLSVILVTRYGRIGKLHDLDRAVRLAQRAIDATTEDHPEIASRLNNLANMLSARYDRTGNSDDLQNAVGHAQSAIDTTTEDHPELASRINNLANMLSARKPRSECRRHYPMASHLNNLANMLSARYDRTGNSDDLQNAVRHAQRAVDTTPEDHPGLPSWLNTLAINLLTRYNRAGDLNDLQNAVRHAQRAVDITPGDHPDLASWLNNLANKFLARYSQTRDLDDLEMAVQYAQRAVDTIPKDHPKAASCLSNLANTLLTRYQETHELKDKDASFKFFSEAFDCHNAMPLERIKAGRGAMNILVWDGDFQTASLLAEKALGLLPIVCSRYLSRDDQQHAILQTSGLAAEAASLLLRTQKNASQALQYLEHGRGLIIGYLIDSRGDISDLAKNHPNMAKEFNRLRYKAFMSISPEDPAEIRRQRLRERDDAVAALECCLKDIRKQEGFDRFLLPLPSTALQENAIDGPIVVVNVTSISSDALMVLPTEIRHIPLPDSHSTKVEYYRSLGLARGLFRLIELDGRESLDILQELNFLCPPSRSELPRIWWIGTGLASSLPFHAAGDHSAGSVENAFSCVLSSYTPSIKMLRYARDRAQVQPDTQSVLLVIMPKTPGGDDLPGVMAEAKAIQETITTPYTVQLFDQPSAEVVLQALRDCSISHFACHGWSDILDPSNSYLALQGQSNSIPDRLTVQNISETHLGQARLAYLSACSTAENRVSKLADEGLHLASGFQVAGFAHTVASMWPSNDEICAQVASIFYRELIVKGGLREGNRAVAVAFHAAVKEVRMQHAEQPHQWAQFVHFGA